MSQHFLNGTQVSTIFQQVGRKGMPQRMRCNLLLDPSQILIMLDDLPKALPGHPGAIHIDKEGTFVWLLDELRPYMIDVIGQSPDRRGIKGNNTFLLF